MGGTAAAAPRENNEFHSDSDDKATIAINSSYNRYQLQQFSGLQHNYFKVT